MDVKKLTDALSVSPQIAVAEIADIAAAGFKSIICNRPDGEAFDQPYFSAIEAGAKSAGLKARYLPITPGRMTPEEVAAFGELVRDLPKPVLAYCRSGARSSSLWARLQTVSAPKTRLNIV